VDKYVESNQKLWDQWTLAHLTSPFYDVAKFKAGHDRLSQIDLEEMPDVKGKSLLHLQCHFGMDTLSWARRGAEVVGVDFSPKAVESAIQLATELNIPSRFVQSDVLTLPDVLEGQFDIVYTSYGAIFWLSNLTTWGKVIHHFLRPGGTFFMIEYHPFLHIFENRSDGDGVEIIYSYSSPIDQPLEFAVTGGSYAVENDAITHPVEYGWNHSFGDIITSLTSTGLHLEYVHEFDYINFQMFQNMEEFEPHRYRLKGVPSLPYMFSLKATMP
jgi:ubiquinone/menaquinone biosynthesis C-methylase UbiE